MEKRRQNHSCDQCRKAKKACDGYILNRTSTYSSPQTASPPQFHNNVDEISPQLLPCSYCVKTKKTCGLNSQWAKPLNVDSSPSHHHNGKRLKLNHPISISSNISNTSIPDSDITSVLQAFQTPSPNRHFDWTTPLNENQLDSTSLCSPEATKNGDPDFEFTFIEPLGLAGPIEDETLDCHNISSFVNETEDLPTIESQSLFWNVAPTQPRRPKNDTGFAYFTLNNDMMAKSNRNLISQGLFQIYHDVLENNLACWVTEDTCPYTTRQTRPNVLSQLQRVPHILESSGSEWGSSWSNRMYRRVKQLDRIAESTKLIRLSRSETQAASKALDLTVAAFATQWTQDDRRRKYSVQSDNLFGQHIEGEGIESEFERNLQQSVWEQARTALRDVAEVECFRVVFAELIFGLIQRPQVRASEHTAGYDAASERSEGFSKSDLMDRMKAIMASDGPPIFMERATRKIHTLKFHFEGCVLEDSPSTQRIEAEERETIRLLYWLATMFDTVSSSVHQRPCVLSDEDSQHVEAQETIKDSDSAASPSRVKRWDLALYAQDNTDRPLAVQWPCSYDDATQATVKSAAVKVLLYRYVSYIQNALRRRESPEIIEDIISSSMSVYRYWSKTHGALFRDLAKNIDSVPSRVRGWFPCIAIPWHLASFMLADLIDLIDSKHIGLEACRRARLDSSATTTIRKANAIELAGLARAVLPAQFREICPGQLPELHFAVNESSLLTEPWTVIFVRAFANAAMFHLDMAQSLRKKELSVLGHETDESQVWKERCENCIRSLWFLGRKSLMAKDLGKVLAEALTHAEKAPG